MILLERFIPGAGLFEIFALSVYAGFLIFKMKDNSLSAKWRKISWTIFTIAFFGQLVLGLLGIEKCLMTGELHFPIPGMILAGTVYRFEISFMPILFLSTIIISGPAWCSQLCYFGAIDNIASSRKKPSVKKLVFKNPVKHIFLLIVIVSAIILRFSGASTQITVFFASALGIIGVIVIITLSVIKKKMVHCIAYCPIGTIVMYLKLVSPFRIRISKSCTECMHCSSKCRYDALGIQDIKNRKPALSCMYCGDCLESCDDKAIQYRFFALSPNASRNLYLIITITLHAVFLGLARI